ncbi:MAG: tRNA (guanosine(37)-N1)-methyltransferase TrmD [Bacteroidetes bacterium HGW-Bacteroidetes-17]|jgi:tRNA (guanine37-N1)-methyltransferase|nr:MAG: tRNA (guanosine(37)-N1)-methyltransferase TrmD [Bacteroidetes bacterium HGW-Bacteroidetes-17]
MKIDIITLFPAMFDGIFNHSILKRAQDKELVSINLHDLRAYSNNKYKSVDDYAFGGGAGMVMMIEPIDNCITALKSKTDYDEIIYLSPDGELFNQSLANQFSSLKNIILLCGHYKGVDERVRQHLITREISIGDYVLSGGELAAAAFTDSIVRLIPGVLGDETSALSDSFQDQLLSPPVYTRPREYKGMQVPDILLSGNDKEIQKWKYDQSMIRTKERRPELLMEDE